MSDQKKLTKLENLLLEWHSAQQVRQVDDDEVKIKVHQMISNVSWVYEKLRVFVDNRQGNYEAYLVIGRILKRLLLLEKRKPEKIPQILLEELIRAGVLKNNTIPKTDLKSVWQILDKYVVLMNKVAVKVNQATVNHDIDSWYLKKKRREINNWLVVLAAREIEKFLLPKNKEELVAKSMYEYMSEQIEIDDETINSQERKIQIYIAVHRAFLKSSNDILSYYLFKIRYPLWFNCDEKYLDLVASQIFKIKEEINQQLNHSIKDNLKKICLRHIVYFIILLEMLNKFGNDGLIKLMKDQKVFEDKTAETVIETYKRARRKIRFGLIKSTFYVLITKYAVIEIPFKHGLGMSSWEYLVVLLLGPAVMILVGLSIKKPNKKNTEKIVKIFKRLIYQDRIRNFPLIVKRLVKRSFVVNLFFVGLYFILFTLTIWLIYQLFAWYGFDILVTSITLFFFSMISYFGFRLREIMRSYVVLDKKENFFGFIFDFISLPILKLGQLLASFLREINFFIPFFDYIIESPFKALVIFFERWTFFIKEKKEELDRGDH